MKKLSLVLLGFLCVTACEEKNNNKDASSSIHAVTVPDSVPQPTTNTHLNHGKIDHSKHVVVMQMGEPTNEKGSHVHDTHKIEMDREKGAYSHCAPVGANLAIHNGDKLVGTVKAGECKVIDMTDATHTYTLTDARSEDEQAKRTVAMFMRSVRKGASQKDLTFEAATAAAASAKHYTRASKQFLKNGTVERPLPVVTNTGVRCVPATVDNQPFVTIAGPTQLIAKAVLDPGGTQDRILEFSEPANSENSATKFVIYLCESTPSTIAIKTADNKWLTSNGQGSILVKALGPNAVNGAQNTFKWIYLQDGTVQLMTNDGADLPLGAAVATACCGTATASGQGSGSGCGTYLPYAVLSTIPCAGVKVGDTNSSVTNYGSETSASCQGGTALQCVAGGLSYRNWLKNEGSKVADQNTILSLSSDISFVTDTSCKNCRLDAGIFTNYTFTDHKGVGTNLTGSSMRGANFSGAYMVGVTLNSVQAPGAIFDNASLNSNVNAASADFTGASFVNAHLNGIVLNNSNISCAKFNSALLIGAFLNSMTMNAPCPVGGLVDFSCALMMGITFPTVNPLISTTGSPTLSFRNSVWNSNESCHCSAERYYTGVRDAGNNQYTNQAIFFGPSIMPGTTGLATLCPGGTPGPCSGSAPKFKDNCGEQGTSCTPVQRNCNLQATGSANNSWKTQSDTTFFDTAE